MMRSAGSEGGILGVSPPLFCITARRHFPLDASAPMQRGRATAERPTLPRRNSLPAIPPASRERL